MSLLQKVTAKLRENGWTYQIVQHKIARSFISKDLFGVFDILAMKRSVLIGIQVAGLPDQKAHHKKMGSSRELKQWLATGNKAVMVALGKRVLCGKKQWVVDQTFYYSGLKPRVDRYSLNDEWHLFWTILGGVKNYWRYSLRPS